MPLQTNPEIRVLYLLSERKVGDVLGFLEREFPAVDFSRHPSMNGFFASGSKIDLLEVKREVVNIDRPPVAPSPPLVEYVPTDQRDFEELKALLGTMLPDLSVRYDPELGASIVQGTPEAIDLVRELLLEGDREIDRVVSEIPLIELTPDGMQALGFGLRLPESMSVSVKTTRLEFMSGVEISNKTGLSRIYIGTMP